MFANLEHASIEPTEGNGWASWFCKTCEQPCSSDLPCDHCMDSIQSWMLNDGEE